MRLSIIRPLRLMRAPSCQNLSIISPFRHPAPIQVQRRFCSTGVKWSSAFIELRDAAVAYSLEPTSKAWNDKLRSYGGLCTPHDSFLSAMLDNSKTFSLVGLFPILKYREETAVVFISDPNRVVLLLSCDCFVPKDSEAVKNDNWFIADFGAVDDKLDAKQVNEAAQIFKQRLMGMLRGVTFADAIRTKIASEKNSAFPHFVSQKVETKLRPPLTREQVVDGLISCSRHRFDMDTKTDFPIGSLNIFGATLEGVLQKTIVINGASGSGKTVLALQVAQSLADVVSNDEPIDTERVVLGLYLKPGERSLGQTESVATEIASKLRSELNKVFDDLKPKERSLKNVLLHVVLDEVGSRTDLCKEILTNHVGVCNEIKTRLSETVAVGDAGYEGCAIQDQDSLKLSLTLVGTGVAYPGADGSMGLPYWRVSSDTASLKVMRRILNLKFKVSESAVVNKEKKDLEPNERAVENFVNFVETDRLLSVLKGNKRMAAQMAVELLKYESFKGELRLVSSAVTLGTVRAYVGANGWKTFEGSKGDEMTHLANLVSLITTQSHGCHVLSPADLTTLTTTVGAMEDMLEWREENVKKSFEHPVETTVNSDLAKKGSKYENKLLPIVKVPIWKGPPLKAYFRTRQPGEEDPNGRIRYHIPPSLALMALIRYADLCGVWLFSSDQQHSSVTYEKFTSLILAATLSAFSSHNVLEFPPHLLFLRTEGSVNEFLKTQPPMKSFFKEGQKKTEHIKPTEFDWLRRSEYDCLAPLTGSGTDFIVEAALPKAAQNDCILYGKGLAIGVESKFYTNEGTVSASVLVKRACQMRYAEVYCEFRSDDWPPAPDPDDKDDPPMDAKNVAQKTATGDPRKAEPNNAQNKPKYELLTVTRELHEFFTSQDSDIVDIKRCEYDATRKTVKITISTAKATRSKDTRLAMVRSCWMAKVEASKDVVVLSGPSGQSLIPEAMTVVFKKPYEIDLWTSSWDIDYPWNPKFTNVKYKFSLADTKGSPSDPTTEAEVVTWSVSLERFLRATSMPIKLKLKNKSEEQTSERIEYSCNVDNSSARFTEVSNEAMLENIFYLNLQNNEKHEEMQERHKQEKFTIKVPKK